jgi:hypothetical protein
MVIGLEHGVYSGVTQESGADGRIYTGETDTGRS